MELTSQSLPVVSVFEKGALVDAFWSLVSPLFSGEAEGLCESFFFVPMYLSTRSQALETVSRKVRSTLKLVRSSLPLGDFFTPRCFTEFQVLYKYLCIFLRIL